MRQTVREAFFAVRDERSPDFVIADPVLNGLFLNECQKRGLTEGPRILNFCLLNLRKSGDLKGIKSKRTVVRDQDEYRFASEIAVRFLERRHRVSLDAILCDPKLADEFQDIAAQIAPEFSPFEYRWAALNLRKRRYLKPESLGRVVRAEAVEIRPVKEMNLDEVPMRPGLYLFLGQSAVLYVGECKSLRKRFHKHLDHSDNKGLARWLWEHGTDNLKLEYHVLPEGLSTRERKAMEAELILSRKPLFNVAGID